MKNFRLKSIIVGAVALCGISTSCNDFLEVEPYSDWEVENFYTNTDELDIALAGMYSLIAADEVYGQSLSIVMESGTDEGYYNRRFNEAWTVGLYRHTSADTYVSGLWSNLYECINLVNLFESVLDASLFEEGVADAYLGEVRFLRGLCYFHLINWYGEVPLKLAPTLDQSDNHLGPSSVEVISDQIIKDLTFASEHLIKANDPSYVQGRANKMAAHGLLARVYLKMSGYPLFENHYEEVMAQCDTIFNDGYHGLTQASGVDYAYRSHFLNYIQNTYDTKESIFEISYSYLGDLGLSTHGRIGALNGVAFNYGGGVEGFPAAFAQLNASPLLGLAYDNPSDQRVDWNIANYRYDNNGEILAVSSKLADEYCSAKFRRWEPANEVDITDAFDLGTIEPYTTLETSQTLTKNFTSINFPVIRYADVLLMYAEASNELNFGPTAKGIDCLNQVRNRAGLENIEDVAPGVLSNGDSFFNEIVDERLRELCFEGLRKQDLIRWELLEDKLLETEAAIVGQSDYDPANESHNAFLRSSQNFDINKHLTLPYPQQEVAINNLLNQKGQW